MLAYLIALPLVFVLLFPASLLSAHVLQILWGWFIVPLGMQPLSFWLAFGLTVVVYHLRGYKLPDDAKITALAKRTFTEKQVQIMEFKYALKQCATVYIAPLFTWLFGYIAHRMMG